MGNDEKTNANANALVFRNRLLDKTKTLNVPKLAPKSNVRLCHGNDIMKKGGNRRNRYLFNFPGFIAPLNGGKIGRLEEMDSAHPILYLEFPQGQFKLTGTIVYPKNKYLTLNCHAKGNSTICEDIFTAIVSFPTVTWIGQRGENPEEEPRPIPKELFANAFENKTPEEMRQAFACGAGKSKTKDEAQVEDSSSSASENESEVSSSRSTLRRKSSTATKSLQTDLEREEEEEDVRPLKTTTGKRKARASTTSAVKKKRPQTIAIDISSDEEDEGFQVSTSQRRKTPASTISSCSSSEENDVSQPTTFSARSRRQSKKNAKKISYAESDASDADEVSHEEEDSGSDAAIQIMSDDEDEDYE